MKPRMYVVGLTLFALAPWAVNAHASEVEAAQELEAPALPLSADAASGTSPKVLRWADRCTDFTTNGWAFKAPANFLPWLDVFSDPGIWLEFTQRGLDPQTYVRTARSLLEPAAVKNYLEWTDPMIYTKWGNALAEPQFLTAVNAILFDPGKFMRWVMLPLDPKPWNILFTAANPETWLRWLNAPFDPKTQEFLAKAADPNTLLQLLDALDDPNNYPGMLAYQQTPAATYGAPETPATLAQ